MRVSTGSPAVRRVECRKARPIWGLPRVEKVCKRESCPTRNRSAQRSNAKLTQYLTIFLDWPRQLCLWRYCWASVSPALPNRVMALATAGADKLCRVRRSDGGVAERSFPSWAGNLPGDSWNDFREPVFRRSFIAALERDRSFSSSAASAASREWSPPQMRRETLFSLFSVGSVGGSADRQQLCLGPNGCSKRAPGQPGPSLRCRL
jgi:hypothetical protein